MARILLMTQPTDGGVFEHVSQLCDGLGANGHEPVVAGPFGELPTNLRAEVVRIEMVRAVAPAADARAVAATARLVRRVRPDLVHAHSSKAGAVARLARPLFPRTPLVYTPHGYAFAGWFDSERERTAYRVAERALAPLASRVLCVCEAERRLATSVGKPGRTRVVHNGVAAPEAAGPHPDVAALRQRGPVVGVVTLLRPGKGIETLIDSLQAVLKEQPQLNVAIAGDGPDRDALSRRAVERGVADRIHFLGATRGAGRVLRGCDLFVSPSWAESFPLTLLEAMSAGLPVVSTDVGGCAEAVDDGTTGIVVPPRDPGALASAIGNMLSDPHRAREFGDAGLRRWQAHFTIRRMIDGTLAVYGDLGVYH